METVIKSLIELAEQLDKNNNVQEALQLDKVASDLMLIKTAHAWVSKVMLFAIVDAGAIAIGTREQKNQKWQHKKYGWSVRKNMLSH
jgi:hypothetical protein